MRANVWKELENYFLILLGTALMAIAIQWIFDRVGLITGGFTGLTIIIRNLTEALLPGGIPLWLTNIVLNIPIFLYSYIRFGKNYIGKTGFATILLSVWLYLIPVIDMSGDDYMLAALFGGAFTGIGMALVLKAGATTGGTDMVAAIIQSHMRHYTVVQVMQVLDAGAEDFVEEEDSFEVLTDPDDFSAVRLAMEEAGIPMVSAEVTMIPQTYVELTDPKDIANIQKTLDMLDDDDDVQEVYHNWDE